MTYEYGVAEVSTGQFTTVFEQNSPRVLNIAMRVLGNRQQAQDVHQDVFLEIWKRWHTYNGKTNWSAYLYRTTIRKALRLAARDRARTRHRTTRNQGAPSPDQLLAASELSSRFAQCLAGLPARQAEIFILSRIEKVKTARIAELMGCSQATVRTHVHHATQRLARQLGDYLVNERR